jgi:hypothetical protein
MSTQGPTGQDVPPGGEPTEEELRAAYEAELKRLRIEDVILRTIVSLLNLAARKAGLVPGTEDERDAEQVRLAIESVRVLLPSIEPQLGEEARQMRDALAQLQLAYTRLAGAAPADAPTPGVGTAGPGGPEPAPEQEPGPGEREKGPAERSGRLWVPGQ